MRNWRLLKGAGETAHCRARKRGKGKKEIKKLLKDVESAMNDMIY